MIDRCLSLVPALVLLAAPLRAGEKIVTLGDSLTFAYEAEFGFRIAIPFGSTYGDGFGPKVRNWIEILNSPTYRNPYFDVGGRKSIDLSFSLFSNFKLFLRHDYNWAIPGLKVDELRRYVSAEASFLELLRENEDFSDFELLLSFSNFDPDRDFNLTELREQIRTSASRLTLFIGGNDARGIYNTVYQGNPAGAFVEEFVEDTAFVLDWVLDLNPDIQIVLVNVPHVGVTPDVKNIWPPDPVKTGRVMALMRELNARIADLAASRNVALADIFTPTLPLLEENPFVIHGIPFANSGSTTGNLDYSWLDGPLSRNFHPNTNVQAMVANEIIDAFNRHYGSSIAPLSATEILGGILEKPPASIDMSFDTWVAAYGFTAAPESDDSDGDGLPAGVEFALGLDPRRNDAGKIRHRLTTGDNGLALELNFPLRLPASAHYSVTATASPDLLSPFLPLEQVQPPGPDGLSRVLVPVTGDKKFVRLESTLTP